MAPRVIIEKLMSLNTQFLIYWGLIFTMVYGVLLRIQFSGALQLSSQFDWYRVHTHAGYYIFMIPGILWMARKIEKTGSLLYYGVAVLCLFVFFFQGYSLLAKILSGLLYLFWYGSYFKNNFKKLNKWFVVPKFGFGLSLIFLFFVIYLPSVSSQWGASQLAKGFLLSLFFLVILPIVLAQKLYLTKWPQVVRYLIGSFLLSLASVGILPNLISILAVLLMIMPVISCQGDKFDKLFWSLILSSVAIVLTIDYPFVYQAKIAGLHFLFLGPILNSLSIVYINQKMKMIYYFILTLFCILIFALGLFPTLFQGLNLLIALLGIVLIVFLFFYKVVENKIK